MKFTLNKMDTTPPPLPMTNSERFISDICNFETQVEGSTGIEFETSRVCTSFIHSRIKSPRVFHACYCWADWCD